jgi:hypothetical protein
MLNIRETGLFGVPDCQHTSSSFAAGAALQGERKQRVHQKALIREINQLDSHRLKIYTVMTINFPI